MVSPIHRINGVPFVTITISLYGSNADSVDRSQRMSGVVLVKYLALPFMIVK
jgi:hypothetical protein